jgi:hypothetical protein
MTLQKNTATSKASAGGDEIDEIMNEIEELQQSMSASQATPAAEPATEPNVMDEFKGGGDDVSMEETLANLKDDEPSGPNLIDQAMEAEAAANKANDEAIPTPELEEVLEEVQSEMDEAIEEDELLDESEAEALDDAVAEAEEAALLAANSDSEDHAEEEEVPMSEAPRRGRSSSGQPTVSVKLTGDMLLRLSYEFEGQEVLVSFADGSLRVELSDGTEFKIPVRRTLRKAA